MTKVELYIDESSSLLSRGGRALYKAGSKMLDEKLKFETIPSNYLEWIEDSDLDCVKHDLILTTKSGQKYNLGSVYKNTNRYLLEQKKKTESWQLVPSLFKHNVDELGKHRSLKGAKEKLLKQVESFLEDVQMK